MSPRRSITARRLRERPEHRPTLAAEDGPPTIPCDVFVFDLASVTTYLLAARVLRAAPRTMEWRPMAGAVLSSEPQGLDADRAAAQRRATELLVPLTWPARHPGPVPRTMRVAQFAAVNGYGGQFMEVASALAFASGMDVENRALGYVEATADAARVDPGQAVAAADDSTYDRDESSERAWLTLQGIGELPALRHGGLLMCGEAVIERFLRERAGSAPRRGDGAE